MSDKEFNLLDERWIRVIDRNCKMVEVSLMEVFRDAHLYQDLCGELSTQDFAVMRLLLAILHTVFARYDLNGNISRLHDPDDALDRWEELWTKKKFPEEVITAYLESQRENFYLFHPERPFFQCEHAKIGTAYAAAKLNGNLSESSNKVRLFSNVTGPMKESMDFAEAARWLLYVNAYDDTSAKPSGESKKRGEKLPSPGVGWLGKLGLIAVSGNTLFETLMLNLIILKESGELWGEEKPVWERDKAACGERVEIPLPDNLSELYTVQSRRLYLKRKGMQVTGYYLLGGEFFERGNAFVEPMTIWRKADSKGAEIFIPRRHDASKQFWRNFSAFIQTRENVHRPGIFSWIDKLEKENIIKDQMLNVKIASVQYGDKDFFVANVFSDFIQMHAALISSMSHAWQNMIINCVVFCDNVSKKVWNFARDVNVAEGGDFVLKEEKCSAKVYANKYKSEFYNRVDAPFRKWLCTIQPETDDADQKEREWRSECIRIASDLGKEIVKQSDPMAILGGVREGCCVAKAMNQFKYELHLLKDA